MYKNDAQQARNYENQITDLVFRNRVKFHLLENNPVVQAKKTTRKKAAPKADEDGVEYFSHCEAGKRAQSR